MKKLFGLVSILAAMSGCTSTNVEGADACQQAVAHIEQCGAEYEQSLVDTCDADTAATLMAMSCEDLGVSEDKSWQGWVSVGGVKPLGRSAPVSSSGKRVQVRSSGSTTNFAEVVETQSGADCVGTGEGTTDARLTLSPCSFRIRNRARSGGNLILQYRQEF